MSKNKRKKGKHYDDGKQLAALVMRAESQFPQGTGKQKRNFVVAGFMDIMLDGVPKFWRGIVRALVRPFILIAIEAVLDYNDEIRAIDDAADGHGLETFMPSYVDHMDGWTKTNITRDDGTVKWVST